jgi:hypothetical protein
MVQLALLSGVYGRTSADFDRSVPINMVPVAEPGDGSGTGISRGYLRLAHGIRAVYPITGTDRGGFVFDGQHLRVIGDRLVRVTGAGLEQLGTVLDDGAVVSFAEGFGRLGIASGRKLYYWDGSSLTLVTDTDLGEALSLAWSDGYFLTTDGTSIVATDLNDPTSVDPLRYGSSEADPDPVVGLLALRGEVYALNRYSIEKFVNTGGTGFPFARSRGSQIPKGCVGSRAFAPFVETFAFCGSARNEDPSIYLAGSGQAIRISPRVLDEALRKLTFTQLAQVELEAMQSAGLLQLMVHLPSETWVYHWTASQLLDVPVWSKLAGGGMADQRYPARHFTLHDGQWWCGGTDKLGVVDETETALFGEPLAFQFDTALLYNGGLGAIVHQAELIALAGRGAETRVALSYTDDGLTWSQERFAGAGVRGRLAPRPTWRRLGRLDNWRGFRFRGVAHSPLAFARLEATLEPLSA